LRTIDNLKPPKGLRKRASTSQLREENQKRKQTAEPRNSPDHDIGSHLSQMKLELKLKQDKGEGTTVDICTKGYKDEEP